MRVLIQRVSKASVEVDGEIISKINRGLLLFVGVTHEDDRGIADHLARKSAQLRIFEDDQQRQHQFSACLLYTSPSPRDRQKSRMPSSA